MKRLIIKGKEGRDAADEKENVLCFRWCETNADRTLTFDNSKILVITRANRSLTMERNRIVTTALKKCQRHISRECAVNDFKTHHSRLRY